MRFFNETATAEIYTLTLHDALPIWVSSQFDRFREGGYPTYEMKITLKDGTAYEDSIQFPKGHPQNPYTREECIENFRVATATIFTAEQCDKLVDLIMNRLEDVEDPSILGEYLKA